MAHFDRSQELEGMVDDYHNVSGSNDSLPRENRGIAHLRPRVDEITESEIEDALEMGDPATDTTAQEARNGKDIQGIPWERFNVTRDNYREVRLQRYENYESLSRSREELKKDYKDVVKGYMFYDFHYNTRVVKPTIAHFQVSELLTCSQAVREIILLRNLLWSTSKHDVYLVQGNSFVYWSSLRRKEKAVLNIARPLEPTKKYPGSIGQTLFRMQICSLAVKDNLMVAGGFQGELICKYINEPGVAFCTKLTTGKNAITNTVDICHAPTGSVKVMAANNDAQLRVIDVESFVYLNRFTFPWSVNNISVSPDGKMVTVVGDDPECLIADAHTGKVTGNLKGHLDYSFASAWHPNGHIVATGNQDTTCRLWDIRNMSRSLAVLKGRMGAIRAVRFSSDGRFLAMAEPADFVHIFDTHSHYESCQEIDLFGEIAGISFSPDTEALFIGVADTTYGSLLEFNRRHHNHYVHLL